MAHSERPALDRILRQPRAREAFHLLTEELSGSDLTSLLLEVFRRRAEKLTPADVLRRSSRDRFVQGSGIPFAWLRRVEDACISALPENFRMLTLSPLEPLGTHSVVAGVDQNNVVSTVRSTEVAADPTNGLALRAAWARAGLLADEPGSPERVRLAAIQRVVRGQRFEEDGRSFAHFELLGMVTAGRDTGNLAFERTSVEEHLRVIVAVLSALGASAIRLELTDFAAGRFAGPIDDLRRELTTEVVEVVERPDRPSGNGYYEGLCFKAFPTFQGEPIEVADGGFVNWTRKLVGSEKERLLISGIGLDRVAMSSPVAQGRGR
jgi:hypothetical protein